jgi:DNA repair protein SbcD/Mre11
MKLLHTGDLHLGKALHETPLIEDQRFMLGLLRNELARDDYAALVISGDVYDRTIPPAEAVELFSGFLVTLRSDFPDLEICIIPGNHDSAQRLSYADRILGAQRIHIICHPENSFTPIILSKGGERLALWLLPFLASGTLKPGEEKTKGAGPELDFDSGDEPLLLSQAELAAEAARRFNRLLLRSEYATIPSVLVAHLFTISGKTSESERVFLGSAEQVSPALFEKFSYVALGHLHRYQRVTDRMYYAGSPLAYAFDEAGTEKCFLKVEIRCAEPSFPVTVTPIPIHPFRGVTRLSGKFADFYAETGFDAHSPEYLEITLTDGELVANPMNLLRPKFPYLLSLRQAAAEIDGGGRRETASGMVGNGTEKRDPVDDFCRLEEMLHGDVDQDRKDLFLKLLAECADEA